MSEVNITREGTSGAMSTLSLAGLESLLQTLDLGTPLPAFAETDVLNDPLDISRSYLADIVREIVQCNSEQAFNAVQLPNTVDPFAGDLTIILPKLAREVGVEVKDLEQNISKQVKLSI
jgi:arginyl-tRNA synthetase